MEKTLNEGITLASLGWDDLVQEGFAEHRAAGLLPGRISVQHKGSYGVFTELGELMAVASGRMRYDASGQGDLPVVGDWVALEARPGDETARIKAILERRTKFSRKVAGFEYDEQVLAANIDRAFVVTSLNTDLNLRRLERYLTMAYANGALPVVVLTKADLCDDVASALERVGTVAIGTPIHAVSALTGEGMDELLPYLEGNQTVALLGSSGVGKSTLVNTLAGEDLLAVREIREDDDRGRHTTTHRQMVLLPSGGVMVDTPGMREMQLWEADEGLAGSFKDIERLAEGCRFRDCRHSGEPGCAVRLAVEAGELSHERLAGYEKLQRELHYLKRKIDQRAAQEETRRWKIQHKAMRRTKSPKV
jgi:ribosome biogenesis GTPase / thiamine phosphate phosphatase